MRIFDGALDRGDLDLASNAAGNMKPPLELHQALDLTLALGAMEEPDYHRAALRWIARFCEEEKPPMEAVKKAADGFNELQTITAGTYARDGLENLGRQIKERHR